MSSNAYLNVCDRPEFRLSAAFLLYSGGQGGVVTQHPVTETARGPEIGAGSLICGDDLERALKTLRREEQGGSFVPTKVLYLAGNKVAWWTRAQRRALFFKCADEAVAALSGKPVWCPPLVFVAEGNSLHVHALSANRRPTPKTRLSRAPFWNLNDRGHMCAGSVDLPARATLKTLAGYEEAFFRSFFTHANGTGALTRHPGGFVGLWKEQAENQARFAPQWLVEPSLSLHEAIRP